jgi:BlaI family transcriptional regulator, penicillinase repressor
MKQKPIQQLTKAEEEIMQVLWELESAFVKDIVARLPKPKPAYNTVSTVVRTLEQKGFVGHEPLGKSHKYYSVIAKDVYTSSFMKGFVKRYFSGSYQQMVSFFTQEDKLPLNELEELVVQLKKLKGGKS